MKKITVNEAMVWLKVVRGRLAELSKLREANSRKEIVYYTDQKKEFEPLYDVKKLDKKCTELENFILEMETKIKQSNAITNIETEADVNILLAPIEE